MVTQEEGTGKVKCKYYTHTHFCLHFSISYFFRISYCSYPLLRVFRDSQTFRSLKYVFSLLFLCQFFMSRLFLYIFYFKFFRIIYSQYLALFYGRRTIPGIWHTHTTWNRDWDQKWALSLLHCGRKEMYVPVHSLIRNTHKITFFYYVLFSLQFKRGFQFSFLFSFNSHLIIIFVSIFFLYIHSISISHSPPILLFLYIFQQIRVMKVRQLLCAVNSCCIVWNRNNRVKEEVKEMDRIRCMQVCSYH